MIRCVIQICITRSEWDMGLDDVRNMWDLED